MSMEWWMINLGEDEVEDVMDVHSMRRLVTCDRCAHSCAVSDARMDGMVWCRVLCKYRRAGWWCASGREA